ncbi:MAG: hypothetical protein JW732_03705 [Dehalococcoidia bacterium]|nr:hypothetical protein [Dehalococcoidia bacterium]
MRQKILPRWLLAIMAGATLIAVMAAPVLASPATATRTLPASVASGAEFDVAIEASGCGMFGQVQETLPDGFTYISCTLDDTSVLYEGNMVRFTLVEDSASFTYRVRAPSIADTTTYTFRGTVLDEDRRGYSIEKNDITVTAGAPGTVTYVLTMAADGDSSSTTPSVGNHVYDAGTVVDISATAGPGWQFDRWSGNASDPTSSSTTVTMDSDKTVTAYFSPTGEPGGESIQGFSLRVTSKPSQGGTVTFSPTGGETGIDEPGEGVTSRNYDADTRVELTATPAEGYVFSSWGGDLSGNANPTSAIMDSAKNVIANFVLPAPQAGGVPNAGLDTGTTIAIVVIVVVIIVIVFVVRKVRKRA